MEKIYSKMKPDVLLHIIYKNDKLADKRIDLVPSEHFLQVAIAGGFPVGHTFKGPHKHLPLKREISTTHESWVILTGKVEVTMYDLNDEIIEKAVLMPGDCYIYLGGGHGFKILDKDTSIYEFKNGPYYGMVKDKEFIGDVK